MGKKGREFDILKDFRGVVKPGEMVLVLGRYVLIYTGSMI
jgi:ATP-binding cassette subfamily G (WHITE) protein 2 (SNQ2)